MTNAYEGSGSKQACSLFYRTLSPGQAVRNDDTGRPHDQKTKIDQKKERKRKMTDFNFNTNCIHAGYQAGSGEPQVLPIVQSTTYRYYNAADVAALFDLESADFMYARIGHPDEDALEKKLTACPAIAPEGNGDGESKKCAALEKWLCEAGFTQENCAGLKIEHFDAPDSRVSSGVRPLMYLILTSGKYLSPSRGGRISPVTVSPFLRAFCLICCWET